MYLDQVRIIEERVFFYRKFNLSINSFQEVLSSAEREKEAGESEVLLMLVKCYWAIMGKEDQAKVKEICFTSLLQVCYFKLSFVLFLFFYIMATNLSVYLLFYPSVHLFLH